MQKSCRTLGCNPRPWHPRRACGRCWEVALGDRRRSRSHLGRRRDTGQPGETIDIPINTGEQSSLALPTGEGNESIMEMQLPMRAQSPCPLIVRQVSSHAASSGCLLSASRSRAGGPAAASAYSHLGLVLADSPERHGFCSLSLAEAEKPKQDALWFGWGEATGAF